MHALAHALHAPTSAHAIVARARSARPVLFLLALVLALTAPAQGVQRKTDNVFLVLVDGLRWQEVFGGAEKVRIDAIADEAERARVRQTFWREDAAARREALMPFTWGTLATRGQIFGNRARGSIVRCTNGRKFSYPGYSEMIVGYPDARIDSNAKKPNPNVTVLEWLGRRPGFEKRVAAVGAWDVVPFILNRERCGFFINAAFEPLAGIPSTPAIELLNRLKVEVPAPWDSMPYDALTFHSALEYVRQAKPRVFWLTFGETDEWAHAGDYRRYLEAARMTDGFLATLWKTLQSEDEYRDKTTLIVSVDHGRGDGAEWTDHGEKIAGAEDVWIAAIGPDTPSLGERVDLPPLMQGQIAATVAALLGEDYAAAVPQAGAPISELFPAR